MRSAGRLSSDRVAGEHRVRVPFAHSLSGPLLAAIEVILGRGVPGWFASGTGFRFAVRGGYAIFHPESRDLEVVAVREAEVTGEAAAARTLHTQYRGTLEAEAEGSYDPDFGQTVDAATRQAEAEAERRITEAARQAAAQQADEAERLVDPELQAEADRDARAGLARNAEAELLAQAQAAEFAGDLVLAASLLEQANRSSAAAVLESWWQAGRGVWVIAAGGKDRVWEVRDPADWAMVWSARGMEPANGSRTVHAADRLRRGLGWADGVVLALSHLWFGDDVSKLGRVAGVLTRPKGSRGSGRRSWADRWAEVPCDAHTAATTAIRLLSTA